MDQQVKEPGNIDTPLGRSDCGRKLINRQGHPSAYTPKA
jgi:hypothetical protein